MAGQVGVLAQEFEKVYPDPVSPGPDGFKAVDYAQLTPVLIEAIKDQQLDALRARNAALQTRAADHAAWQVRAAQAEADPAGLQTLKQQLAARWARERKPASNRRAENSGR